MNYETGEEGVFFVLGSLFLVLGSWFLVLGSWFLVPCSWLRKPGEAEGRAEAGISEGGSQSFGRRRGGRFLVPGSLFLVLGFLCLVSCAWLLKPKAEGRAGRMGSGALMGSGGRREAILKDD